jgi:hypothetical protein
MEDKQEIKFGIKGDSRINSIMKDIQSHQKEMVKKGLEIPKTITDWKKEQILVKKEIIDTTRELEKYISKMSVLHSKIQLADSSNKVSLERTLQMNERKVQSLEKELTKHIKINESIKAHTQMMGMPSKGTNPIMNAAQNFSQGGVSGLVSGLLSSGLGKLGIAGLAIGGIIKTYNWATEKSEPAKDYYLKHLQMQRGYNTGDLSEGLFDAGSKFHVNGNEMTKYASSIMAETGRRFANVDSITGFAKYGHSQGIGDEGVAQIAGAGLHGGYITDETNKTEYLNIYANAMEKGLDLGFNKNKRIGQMVRLQEMAAKDGPAARESFQKLVASLTLMESTGKRSLMGEGGISAIKASQGILGADKTSQFTAWAMSGLIDKQYIEKSLNDSGISSTLRKQLPHDMIMGFAQEQMKTGGLEFFEHAYGNMKAGPHKEDAARMYLQTVNDPAQRFQLAKFISEYDKMSAGDRNKPKNRKLLDDKLKELLTDPQQNLSLSVRGLQSEFSRYLTEQGALTAAIVALDATITAQLELQGVSLEFKKNLKNGPIAINGDNSLGMNMSPGGYDPNTHGMIATKQEIGAIIHNESRGNPNAFNKKGGGFGAIGLMGIRAPALTDYNRAHPNDQISSSELYDPEKNMRVGTWYYNERKKAQGGDTRKALGAYFGGDRGSQGKYKNDSIDYTNKAISYMGRNNNDQPIHIHVPKNVAVTKVEVNENGKPVTYQIPDAYNQQGYNAKKPIYNYTTAKWE